MKNKSFGEMWATLTEDQREYFSKYIERQRRNAVVKSLPNDDEVKAHIDTLPLNFIVHEKLNKITVPQADKDFFKRVKRFFKKFASKK